MRFCVLGAGALGGVIGGRLAEAGEVVTLVVRGAAHRAAINDAGLGLLDGQGETRIKENLRAVGGTEEAGAADVVILAVKAHQIPDAVAGLRSLLVGDAAVLTLQNGIPWWYFQRHGGSYEGRRLGSLDPDGIVTAAIPPERIIGAVAYVAGAVVGPGRVRHGGGNRLPLGELDGRRTARAEALSQALERAGFEAPVRDDIRAELWFKAWGNACFNPIAALTHATVGRLVSDPSSRSLVVAMMEEQRAIAQALGVELRQTTDARIAVVEKIARHKPSMLQDVEAGRALEIEALAGTMVELGRLTRVPTPHFDAVYACAKLIDRAGREERLAFTLSPVPA